MANQKKKPETQVTMIDLAIIAPDPGNPRKSADADGLRELAESIKSLGIIQPITVRPDADGFVVICGHRRLHAARSAGLEQVPCIVRHGLSESEILEIQVLENLQREDVNPMDEARAFQSLCKKIGVDLVASRIGKSQRYVSQRIRLTHLIPVAADLLRRDILPIGHATMIAKLDAESQREALGYCFYHHDFEYAELDDQIEYDRVEISEGYEDVKRWISNRMKPMSQAPFDVNDADLEPVAGSCTACTKRTGSQTSLFADITENDECLDRKCWDRKCRLHDERMIAEARREFKGASDVKAAEWNDERGQVNGQYVAISRAKGPGAVPLVVTNHTNDYRPGDIVWYYPPQPEPESDMDDEEDDDVTTGTYSPKAQELDNDRMDWIKKFMEACDRPQMEKNHMRKIIQLLAVEEIRLKPYEIVVEAMHAAGFGEQAPLMLGNDYQGRKDALHKMIDWLCENAGLWDLLKIAMACEAAYELDEWMDGDYDFEEGEDVIHDTTGRHHFRIDGIMAALDLCPIGSHKDISEI